MRLAYIAATALFAIPLSAQSKGNLPPEAIYAQSKGSVVTILTFDANKAPLAQGSGFVVAKNRVATNYHVLAGSSTASIVFSDGSVVTAKSIVGASQPQDIAIVEAETGSRLPLPLGDELQLKVGETVYAIGAPNGLTASLSNGLVSAFRQDEGQFLIQITAAIAPGSSGGPLFNSHGQVVGVTTSRLKDAGFGFAVGAGDLEHLLKVPLPITMALSDLPSEATAAPEDELKPVQDLFDKKEYAEALNTFQQLSAPVKAGFDGQLLLCRIQVKIPDYELAVRACDAAIAQRPDSAQPYGLKALTLLAAGDAERAEPAAAKATQLSDDEFYVAILGLTYYSEEKYSLVPRELSANTKDPLELSLLAGAALHNHDLDSFQQLCARITSIKGDNNGWQLYREGVSAELNLDFGTAKEKYRKCDDDEDFLDPVCILRLANVETRSGLYDPAKTDIDKAVARFPQDHTVLSEAIFIDLLTGNSSDARRLHDSLASHPHEALDEGTDCLYFYGVNEPGLATEHCAKSLDASSKTYTPWSNAGYVALDNGQYHLALTYFAKAKELYDASTEKHTVTEEIDLTWGILLAAYFNGDRKDAKAIYRGINKAYPDLSTMTALKQLPLIWSDATQVLMSRVMVDFK